MDSFSPKANSSFTTTAGDFFSVSMGEFWNCVGGNAGAFIVQQPPCVDAAGADNRGLVFVEIQGN